ncbi:antibiotic biosynthesis monooxygenase family protein [Phytohabitans sp. ZYX-F-186]|uniref:Antibiotic biosynthesis monooxygenase family protein n=1 Tax=Phytohabitans maris TaxID=3071409 RepID=A0ABU0ZK57_9ACTN|nr:antibiotic biosynthesis monooxygenase family protein [Phytohabitans sp. ZYX-F-186]MDQ7907424.1 antibiotic biosynthesis monooxygenase family protein [Phytohabitans sp. ZYX-F-186]
MPAPDVFRVMLRFTITEGTETAFERVWFGIAERVRGTPGNLEQWLMRDAEDPSTYYLISDWTDETRFREFERSAGHAADRASLTPFRYGVSMSTMLVLRHFPGSFAAASPAPSKLSTREGRS